MASTYSSDLRIELIANGEQSGTWGSTTNNNLGTLIEDAISGMVTVTVTSSAQALTALNGAADEARCAAIEVVNGSGGNCSIYAPPVTKIYVVKNTSLLYNVTVYANTGPLPPNSTIAAGAGVVVPPEKTMLIRCDTVDMIDCVSHLNSLTLNTALPTPSGGTGFSSYNVGDLLYASSNVALAKLASTNTGNVLITNGVNTAPSWGKVDLAAAVTGVLPLANGGLGLSNTAPRANSIIIGTGSAYALANLVAGTNVTITSTGGNVTIASTGGGGGGGTGTVTQVTDGDGMNFTTFTTSGTITLGTPSSITSTSTNSLTASSHTHAITGAAFLAGTQSFTGKKTFTGGVISAAFNFTDPNESIYGVAGEVGISTNNTGRVLTTNAAFRPTGDNNYTLGASGNKWSVVYAGTGTINTSDSDTKQDIADLDDAEKRVAVRIKGLIKKFRFKDAVAAKGDAARIHVGVIAQEVRDAFAAEGLSADRYGLFCSDTWWEKEVDELFPPTGEIRRVRRVYDTPVEGGTEVTRLGVRYEELLAFVIAAM